MFWTYSTSEIKTLLVATLLLFSGFAFLVSGVWQEVVTQNMPLTANTVGVYAGVGENEVNTLVAQLDARARELDEREQMLVASQRGTTYDEVTLLLLTLSAFGMFGLILLNFYLDSRRRGSFAVATSS